MDPILELIDEALLGKGLSDAAASKLAVGNYSLIKNMRSSRSDAKRYNYQALERLAEVLDLECYFGPKRDTNQTLPTFGFAEDATKKFKGQGSEQPDQLFLPIPFSQQPGLPRGAGPIAFRQDWFDHLGLTPDSLAFVNIDENSMSPVITSGALVLIDEFDRSPSETGIFAVFTGGKVDATRLTDVGSGYTAIAPLQQTAPPTVVRTDELSTTLRVLGRIVWHSAFVHQD